MPIRLKSYMISTNLTELSLQKYQRKHTTFPALKFTVHVYSYEVESAYTKFSEIACITKQKCYRSRGARSTEGWWLVRRRCVYLGNLVHPRAVPRPQQVNSVDTRYILITETRISALTVQKFLLYTLSKRSHELFVVLLLVLIGVSTLLPFSAN